MARGGDSGGGAGSVALAAVGIAAVAGLAIGSLVVQHVMPDAFGTSTTSSSSSNTTRRNRRRRGSGPGPRLQRSNTSVEACRQHRVRCRTARASVRMHETPVHLMEAALPLPGLHRLPNAAVLALLHAVDLPSLCRLSAVSSAWARLLRMLAKDKKYLQACAWRGFPPEFRFDCWVVMMRSEMSLNASAELYQQLSQVNNEAVPASGNIIRDLHRTLPESDALSGSAGRGRLFRVLKAYAASDPDVGYCQGMNFIAGFLLTVTSEENAFYLLDRLMREFEARWLYSPGLPHLSLSLWQLDKLTEMKLPELHAHLQSLKVQPQLYASEWFVGFFAYTLSLEDTARIWDLFLTQGWKALHRVALAYLSLFADKVLTLGFEKSVRYLKTAPRSDDTDIEEVLRVAASMKVTNAFLDALEVEYFAEEGRH